MNTDGTRWSTADLFDEHEDDVEVCDTTFLRFGRRRVFAGECDTVLTRGDNRGVLAALSRPGNGRVLVVDSGGDPRIGVLGDRLAGVGVDNGWVGVVLNGAMRDSGIVDGLDFGVFAVAVTARRSTCAEPAQLGVDVTFGGASFRRGGWVYADGDSVLSSLVQIG